MKNVIRRKAKKTGLLSTLRAYTVTPGYGRFKSEGNSSKQRKVNAYVEARGL